MKKFSIALLAAASALAITPAALAGTITGSIGINGSDDTWSLSQIKFTTNTHDPAKVAPAPATMGSLSSVIGDDVTFNTNPLIFASADGKELFSTGDGVTFTITSLTVDYDMPGLALVLNGTGTLTENGYTDTDAIWTLSSSASNGSTTFGIDAAPPIPEPSSLLLLGTGLFGLAFVAFRKSKPSGLVLHP
jgi:hypothetical protein